MDEKSVGEEVLRVENLTKIYPGGIVANYNVNFSVNKGEIHALAGENGAGKSTLMKMLFGIEEITSGSIYLRGEKVDFHSSHDAIANGIGMVQQHMMLVPSMTVAENLLLGIEKKKGLILDRKAAIEETRKISENYSLPVDAEKKVRDISVGMKQKLEILKTMYRGARIIILDEPTAVLAPQETDELFEQLKALKRDGYTIIFISHKLNEVKYLCDRLTVLKNGRTVGTYNVADVKVEDISRIMVGRDVSVQYEKQEKKEGPVVLNVKELCYTDVFGTAKLKKLSFSLKKGEVLGIAGIEGNGQREAVEIITGNLKPDSGSVTFKSRELCGLGIPDIRELGIAHVPEDRNLNGCAPEMSVRNNLIAVGLKRFANKLGVLRYNKMDEFCNGCIREYGVKIPSLENNIKSLSGGNVQKAIVAREFSSDADVIVLNQPTRGVDVGAMEFIHKKILEMREHDKSLILVSADLAELRALSDRILVIYQGRIVGLLDHVKEVSEEYLGLYMLGLKEDSDELLKEA